MECWNLRNVEQTNKTNKKLISFIVPQNQSSSARSFPEFSHSAEDITRLYKQFRITKGKIHNKCGQYYIVPHISCIFCKLCILCISAFMWYNYTINVSNLLYRIFECLLNEIYFDIHLYIYSAKYNRWNFLHEIH